MTHKKLCLKLPSSSEPLPGVLVLKLGSNVVLGCRGSVSVDGVPLASTSVTNKKYRSQQTEDITVSWTSRRGAANEQTTSRRVLGGILRRPHLSWADAGNYSCYRGERLISTFRISVGVPPERPTVYCYKKFHTSKVRCDWTSKNPVTPRPLCYLLLSRESESFGNVTRVPCSFSRSRCWCAFHVEEGDKALHVAKLCVSNTAGNATSPYLNFNLHDIIKPDPPTQVVVRTVEGQEHMLKVSWSYPSSWKHDFYTLHFQLRYRPQLAEQVKWDVLIDDRMSWTIYDALPHAQYEVQLQAKDEFDGIWSDWTDTVYAVSWTGNKIHGVGLCNKHPKSQMVDTRLTVVELKNHKQSSEIETHLVEVYFFFSSLVVPFLCFYFVQHSTTYTITYQHSRQHYMCTDKKIIVLYTVYAH
uniref:Interleukin 6 receptor n=1 Tax=Cyprinus carpio TaxID=7962 RepID=A0A8C1NHG5_CYPCA